MICIYGCDGMGEEGGGGEMCSLRVWGLEERGGLRS